VHLIRPAPASGTALSNALTPRLVERLMRIKGDLRLGLPVALQDRHHTALVAWVETLTEDRLAALAAIGPLQLALTRRRAEALGVNVPRDGGDILRLDIPDGADLNWLRVLTGQGINAAVTAASSLPAMQPATPLHEAALALAKLGQILPTAVIVPVQDAGAEAMRLGLMPMHVSDIMDALRYDHQQHCVSSTNLPMDASKAGRVHVFGPENGGAEHHAIEVGNPDLHQPVTVRLHSACFTLRDAHIFRLGFPGALDGFHVARFGCPTLNGGRRVMTSESWGLGDFGDERLAKRGVYCSREWWRARAPACGVWRVVGAVGLSDFRAFWPIRA